MREETIEKLMRAAILVFIAFGTVSAAVLAGESGGERSGLERATFAGGCFWCTEADFEKVDGVVSVVSGYIGGEKKSPTYRQVSAGATGHAEAVQVDFDPARVSYEELLDVFWHHIDPTVKDRQFCDVGSQYRSGIFFHDEMQREAAERSRAVLMEEKPFDEPIVTEISAATRFYPAEDYHQDYYKKSSSHYKSYRRGCGRDRRLRELWGEER